MKHVGKTTLNGMVMQVQDMVKKLVKSVYPWIHLESKSWPDIVEKLMNYRPKLYVHNVVWTFPNTHRLKCNTDGASKGNPDLSSYTFCLRDSQEDLVYARAAGLGNTTNTEAELMAIYEALEYCLGRQLKEVTIETDSLSLV
ncbi:hypothetical protein KY285_028649 [Solanum tuberosum]|nr:hypothetical protein KY284_028596 [Solanum tuberosum]KAH0667443.1 hypothetical protein KY285_028649 [Solanum tuberosum]